MTSVFHTCVAVESCMGTRPLHWHAHHTKKLCYCRKCKVAVVGFDGSPEVTSTKDLCLCGSNLLCVDVSKASPVALQSNARYCPCSYILIRAVQWSYYILIRLMEFHRGPPGSSPGAGSVIPFSLHWWHTQSPSIDTPTPTGGKEAGGEGGGGNTRRLQVMQTMKWVWSTILGHIITVIVYLRHCFYMGTKLTNMQFSSCIVVHALALRSFFLLGETYAAIMMIMYL